MILEKAANEGLYLPNNQEEVNLYRPNNVSYRKCLFSLHPFQITNIMHCILIRTSAILFLVSKSVQLVRMVCDVHL